MSMQFLLKSSRSYGNIPLIIVDKSDSVYDHYAGILADSYEIKKPYYGDRAVEDFVDAWARPTDKDSTKPAHLAA